MVVVVSMLTKVGSERLTGVSVVREDVRQAVIRATLDSLNRRLESCSCRPDRVGVRPPVSASAAPRARSELAAGWDRATTAPWPGDVETFGDTHAARPAR